MRNDIPLIFGISAVVVITFFEVVGPKGSDGPWIVWLTAGLVVVGFGQLLMFRRQLDAMKQGLNDAARTARAAVSQAEIAEKTFKNLERPYLFVSGVERLEIDPASVGGLEPFVRYNVANYGKIPAIIEEVYVGNCSSHTGGPHIAPLVDLKNPLMSHRIVAPGEVRSDIRELACTGVNFTYPSSSEVTPELADGESYFVDVLIRYRGPFTEGHVTRACWRLSELDNRFDEFGHHDFNYVR